MGYLRAQVRDPGALSYHFGQEARDSGLSRRAVKLSHHWRYDSSRFSIEADEVVLKFLPSNLGRRDGFSAVATDYRHPHGPCQARIVPDARERGPRTEI